MGLGFGFGSGFWFLFRFDSFHFGHYRGFTTSEKRHDVDTTTPRQEF
jgi:hypothetical protein